MAPADRIGHPPFEMDGFAWVKSLGRGGFAETHLFADLNGRFGSHVAVKVPHDQDKEEHLIRGDLSSLATLRDVPFIARMLDIRRVENRYVLLMEYVEGDLLRDLLGAPGTSKKLPVAKAVQYALQVARGLEAAHKRRMVHRDIKPENIIIDKASDMARILDFGIASMTDTGGFFETTSRRHTPSYTPGEVLFDGKGDHRVDVYGLGMTLFEMLTGTLPYYEADGNWVRPILLMRDEGPPSLRDYNPKIPRHIEDIVHKAIAPDLPDRFTNMTALVAALETPAEIKLAQDHAAAGSIRRAERILLSLITKAPRDSRGYVALAALLSRCQRLPEARERLEQAIELDPWDPELHWRIGITCGQLGDKEKARECLNRAKEMAEDKKLRRKIESLLATFS